MLNNLKWPNFRAMADASSRGSNHGGYFNMMWRYSIQLAAVICLGLVPVTHAHEPLVVAHRGLLHHAPENTLANFRACLELRLGFEFDVEKTKDGQLICIHDIHVDRTTNGTGEVAELTLEQIRELDAGSWFDPRFAGEKVPTVDEIMAMVSEYSHHDVLIAVDLKAVGVEEEVVRLAEKYQVLGRLLFIGTTIVRPDVRARLKQASLNARTATVANDSDQFAQALEAEHTDWIYLRFLPTNQQMESVRRAGKRAFIAGVTVSGHVPENWRLAAEVGLDGVLTDYPLELLATLRTRQRP